MCAYQETAQVGRVDSPRHVPDGPRQPRGISERAPAHQPSAPVSKRQDDSYLVSGGANSHITHTDHCDCADHQARDGGWWCKHRLAVRLSEGDSVLQDLAGQLAGLEQPDSLAGNLAGLALGRRIAGR